MSDETIVFVETVGTAAPSHARVPQELRFDPHLRDVGRRHRPGGPRQRTGERDGSRAVGRAVAGRRERAGQLLADQVVLAGDEQHDRKRGR